MDRRMPLRRFTDESAVTLMSRSQSQVRVPKLRYRHTDPEVPTIANVLGVDGAGPSHEASEATVPTASPLSSPRTAPSLMSQHSDATQELQLQNGQKRRSLIADFFLAKEPTYAALKECRAQLAHPGEPDGNTEVENNITGPKRSRRRGPPPLSSAGFFRREQERAYPRAVAQGPVHDPDHHHEHPRSQLDQSSVNTRKEDTSFRRRSRSLVRRMFCPKADTISPDSPPHQAAVVPLVATRGRLRRMGRLRNETQAHGSSKIDAPSARDASTHQYHSLAYE